MSAASDQREIVFARDAGVCFASLTLPGHVCEGDPQCAHLLPKAEVRNHAKGIRAAAHRFPGHPLLVADLDLVLYDVDNAVVLCDTAHGAWDRMGVRCTREQLPIPFLHWAQRWRLEHRVEAYYAASELAAA